MIARLLLVACLLATATPSLAQAPETPEAPTSPPAAAPAATGPKAKNDDLSDIPPELLARMSPEHVVKIIQSREATRQAVARRDDEPAVATLVPLGSFLTAFMIVALILRFRSHKHAKLHETMQKMIEKGIEIPAALMFAPPAQDTDLRKGLILIGAGLGIAVALFVLAGPGFWTLGLIPLFVGVGYLVVFGIEARRKEA